MWTPTIRVQHSRAGLRYGSDVTDAEWLILSPLLPAPRPFGCPLKWEMREIVNAIFYVLCGGIAWSLLPKDFPPSSTAYRWFARFRERGHLGDDQPSPGDARPRARWPPSKPDSGGDRQPERQDDRERRHPWLRRRQEDQGPQAPCVTNTPSDRRVWCYAGDEGWPLEVGSQVQASNRCKLRL